MKNLSKYLAFGLIIIGIISRFLPHPPNFTTIGATAVFSGALVARPWNYLLPILILAVTDFFLGLHQTMFFVYISFILTIFLSEMFLKKSLSPVRAGGLGVANALLFYLITNFGVWLTTPLYPPTLDGLIQSYIMGLPFLRNMLVADIIFSVGFISLYNWSLSQQTNKILKNKVVIS